MPQSDYLMTWRTILDKDEKMKLGLVFENDPGRRNRSIVGARHLINILSLHMISPKLMLVRFGESLERSYWSLLTTNGHNARVSPDLSQKLKEKNWTRIQTCIVKA